MQNPMRAVSSTAINSETQSPTTTISSYLNFPTIESSMNTRQSQRISVLIREALDRFRIRRPEKRVSLNKTFLISTSVKRGVLENFSSVYTSGEENEKHMPCKQVRRAKSTPVQRIIYFEVTCAMGAGALDSIPSRNFVCVNVRRSVKVNDETIDLGVSCELRCKGHDCAPYYV